MSGWKNYDDVISTLKSHDFDIVDIEVGVMKRVKRLGHSQKGWYIVHEIVTDDHQSALIGSFGYWSGSEPFTEKISAGKGITLSAEQKKAINQRAAADKKHAEAARRKVIESAARQAQNAWRKYVPEGESEYLTRKQVKAHGLRFQPSGNGTVAVPMQDVTGKIYGLQIIRGKKRGHKLEKEFWPKGHEKKGKFHLLGVPGNIIMVGEGEATCASAFEAMNMQLATAVAFDGGNMIHVANELRKVYKRAKFLFLADDDYLVQCKSRIDDKGNFCGTFNLAGSETCSVCKKPIHPGHDGENRSREAALAVDGAWIMSKFADERPLDQKGDTDFNDLHVKEGISVVNYQITEKLTQLGWVGGVAEKFPIAQNKGIGGLLKSILNVPEAVERYSLIYGGRNAMFDHEERIVVHKDDVLNICVDHCWREWKLHMDRKVVRLTEVGFDPTGLDSQIKCNLWGGWPTKPRQGSCEKLLELLRYLCMEDDKEGKVYDWLLKWLAYPIQHPGAKMQSAVVVHGVQGTGKSRFFEAYASIFGEYGLVLDQGAIEDKFNSDWASKRLFVLADEIVARQDMYHIKNRLKTFITGKTIRINPKSLTAHTECNHMNIVFLSNEKMPVALKNDDRRHCIIWTPPMPDDDFFDELNVEIEADGAAALHHTLVNLELGNFKPWTKPPMTDSKHDLIDLGLDSSERFLRDWQQGETRWPFMPCGSMDLYAAYARWCRENGVARQRESNQFLGHIKKMRGWTNQARHRYENDDCIGDTKQTRMVIPEKDLLEKAELRPEAEQTQSQWLTKCFFEFRRSLDADR